MMPVVARVIVGFVLGALTGVMTLTAVSTWTGGLTLEMYRDLPGTLASGFYPVEGAGATPYAWTSRTASLQLNGFRREVPWACTIRFRGGRVDASTLPLVQAGVDGVSVARRIASNEFEDLIVPVAPNPAARRLTLTIAVDNTFTPGLGDSRDLGIQVTRIACQASESGIVLPPITLLGKVAVAGGLIGAAVGGTTLLGGWSLVLLLIGSVGQAVLLASGLGPHGGYANAVLVWAAVGALVAAIAVRWPRTAALHPAATGVILLSVVIFQLKVLGLLHPDKLIIDAVFHAHRLQWVLDGRYYFTQPLPNGVSFPYAIGLYVVAMPLTAIFSDYVTLLRVIVTAAEVTAGGLLYTLTVRVWNDRVTGVLAVVLFHTVPLPWGILGNANLTNVFAQALAVMTLVTAALLTLRPRRIALLCGLCALAFLSHVGTFVVLGTTMAALAGLFWLGEQQLRRIACVIAGVAVLSAVLAAAAYYSHFGEVYAQALGTRGAAVASVDPLAETSSDETVGLSSRIMPRLVRSVQLSVLELGWPLLLLAAAGTVNLVRHGRRDRLTLLLAAYAVAYVIFFAAGVTTRVDASLERYATEFVGRVNLASYPAIAILAARGAAWGWTSGVLPGRLAVMILLAAACRLGVLQWRGWIA